MNEAEDIKHLLFTCDRTRGVWQTLGVCERVQNYLDVDPSDSVVIDEIIRREEVINELDVGLAGLVLTAGWYLWWERRQIVHEETVQTPARTAMSIAALTENYQIAGMEET
jgi:hypothetical protein